MRVVLGIDAMLLLSEPARSFAASIFAMLLFRGRRNERFNVEIEIVGSMRCGVLRLRREHETQGSWARFALKARTVI